MKIIAYLDPASPDIIECYARDDQRRPIEATFSVLTDEPGRRPAPLLRLSIDDAQRLMDSLWEIGLRPVGAKGSAGQLAAVQYHLEDMRKLVFGKAEGGR